MKFKNANDLKMVAKKAEDNKSKLNENVKEVLLEIIIEAASKAKKGLYSLQIREYGFSSTDVYCNKFTEKQEMLMNELKDLGFKVEVKVVEHQFVDVYLEISWY